MAATGQTGLFCELSDAHLPLCHCLCRKKTETKPQTTTKEKKKEESSSDSDKSSSSNDSGSSKSDKSSSSNDSDEEEEDAEERKPKGESVAAEVDEEDDQPVPPDADEAEEEEEPEVKPPAEDTFHDPHQNVEEAELRRRVNEVRAAHERNEPQLVHAKNFVFDKDQQYGQCRRINEYRLNKCRDSFGMRGPTRHVESVALRVGVILVILIMHTWFKVVVCLAGAGESDCIFPVLQVGT